MGCATRRLMYILCIFTFAHNERDDKERKHVHTHKVLCLDHLVMHNSWPVTTKKVTII